MSFAGIRRIAGITGLLFFVAVTALAQDLGHKLPGTLGLDAARVPEPGLYFAERLAIYQAGELRDANGNLISTGPFNLQAFANGLGGSYTTGLSWRSTFLTVSVGWPISHLTLNAADRLQAGVDRFGLGDPYIQPVRLGWRHPHFDFVTSYGIYIPIGRSALAGGNGVSSGQITHEFSGGGTRYFKDRTGFLTGLASYQLYSRQRGIDVTRGDSVQIQGGTGMKWLGQSAESGLAGYALWQISDNRGTALPPVLRTARDRVYGLGPESAVFLKPIRAQLRARYEWDFGVQARPQGHIFVAGINFVLHRPPQRAVTP